MIAYFIEGKDSTRLDSFISECLGSLFLDTDGDFEIDITVNRFIDDVGEFAGLCTGDTESCIIDLATHFRMPCGEEHPYEEHEFASNLAHELVHAKQFCRNQINNTNDFWKRNGKSFDCTGMEYAETPWEVEAYGLEQVLTDVYWSD